jgi:hypothetical protein
MGLTQRDIEAALLVAEETQPDLIFPDISLFLPPRHARFGKFLYHPQFFGKFR